MRKNNNTYPPYEIFNDINYFITGSRRFKTNRDNSDLDVCICIDSIDEIKNRIKNNQIVSSNDLEMGSSGKIKYSQYNNGIKFKYMGLEINVIPLHPVDYICWFHAAKLMDVTPLKKGKTRSEIHGIYQTYCGLMKTQFASENINIKNYLNYVRE